MSPQPVKASIEGAAADQPPLTRPFQGDDRDFSFLALGTALLRRRKTIVRLALVGGVLGLTLGLLRPRQYVSTAIFIPQASETGTSSGLAMAASQFGLSVPGMNAAWGPPVYVELLSSRAILEPIVWDTLAVVEQGGRRIAVLELLEAKGTTPAGRVDGAVRALDKLIEAGEIKTLGAVKVVVSTRWPSVSVGLADRLVRGINTFNVERRKSQASAERQFVEARAAEAERALRDAEDKLLSFLQRNRVITGSSQVAFEKDRLDREVALRQQAYTSLVVNRDEARIREVRDIPLITVLETPRLPLVAEPRGAAQRAVLGAFAAGMIGVLIALIAHGFTGARQSPTDASREFFQLLDEARPGFMKRRGR